MALPPQSPHDWLKEPRCPNCEEVAAKIPEDQQVTCTCGTEFIVLSATVDSATEENVFWTMPATEFFEKIDDIWQQLREET